MNPSAKIDIRELKKSPPHCCNNIGKMVYLSLHVASSSPSYCTDVVCVYIMLQNSMTNSIWKSCAQELFLWICIRSHRIPNKSSVHLRCGCLLRISKHSPHLTIHSSRPPPHRRIQRATRKYKIFEYENKNRSFVWMAPQRCINVAGCRLKEHIYLYIRWTILYFIYMCIENVCGVNESVKMQKNRAHRIVNGSDFR